MDAPLQAKRRRVLIRARAIVLGLLLIPLLCAFSLRTELICGGTELIEASLLLVVVFTLFLLTLANEVVRRWRPSAALTQAELLFVYLMQSTSIGLAGLGQIQFLNQALGGAFYYATPENHWAAFFPYIPRWWVPDQDVLKAYYRGGSTFFTVAHVWGWARPICVWTGFLLLMFFCFLCLNTLLRRAWMEQERLTFPLVTLPLEITRAEMTRSILRQHAFWAAFIIACLYRSVSGLHRMVPSFPDFPDIGAKGQLVDLTTGMTNPPWDAIGYFRISLHPMIVGITYLLPLDVSFSAWFFYLMVKVENIASSMWGFSAEAGPAGSPPYTGEQGTGAFLAIALFSVWGARRHLRAVWRKAIGRAPEVSDADEALSYRVAVFGLFGSFLGLVLFATLGGLRWYLSAAFFILYLIMITACTRLRAEAGPMLGYGPDLNPHEIMVQLPGSQNWNIQNLTPLAYFQWFDSDYRTVAMPPQMEAMKMADVAGDPLRGQMRSLARWMMVAAAVAILSAFVSVLAIYYHYGAATVRGDNDWRIYNGKLPFVQAHGWLADPQQPNTTRLAWIGIGFILATLLARARTALVWWPFHPAGFALAQAGAAMQWVWFPTLLGWASKALILRYGGIKSFRRFLPFFLGLILGDIVIACLWAILGVILDSRMYMFFPG
jgi:hypothetical protein